MQGLTADDVRRQAEEIAAAGEALAPFRVLRGIECDILPDGRLDLPDDVLAELDWVQASVHGGQRMPAPEMTRRVVEAISHPHVSCLSHPTGRLIGRRPENAVDLDRVYEVAREHGVAVEVNGLPDRLDLRGEHVRDAIAGGVRIVCSTDAHGPERLAYMELAVAHGAPRRGDGRRRRQRRSGRRALGFARWRRSFSTATPSATRPCATRSGSRSSTRCCSRSRTGARRSSPARSRPRASRRRCPDAELVLLDELGFYEMLADGTPRDEAELEVVAARRAAVGDRAARSCPPTYPSRSPTSCATPASGSTSTRKAVEARRRGKTAAELEGIRRAQRAAERGMAVGRAADPRRHGERRAAPARRASR